MTKSVLVIDDDKAVRKAFVMALEDKDYFLETAESGEVGIAMLKEKSYDLVFLDLKMPGINGAQALQRLRKLDDGVPVYIVTAFHKEFLRDLGGLRQQGIKFDLLRKPLTANEIVLLAEGILDSPTQY